MKILFLIRGRFRLLFGFCPKCNSDAPEKDNCKVCYNFYGYALKKEKIQWWSNFKSQL